MPVAYFMGRYATLLAACVFDTFVKIVGYSESSSISARLSLHILDWRGSQLRHGFTISFNDYLFSSLHKCNQSCQVLFCFL
jgi:hypothetical protein